MTILLTFWFKQVVSSDAQLRGRIYFRLFFNLAEFALGQLLFPADGKRRNSSKVRLNICAFFVIRAVFVA
jgi:hypothetical protein